MDHSKELLDFLEKNAHRYETIDDAITAFIYDDNTTLSEGYEKIEESYDLMERAVETSNQEQTISLLNQAIDCWPDNIDAHMLLLMTKYENQPVTFINRLIQLEKDYYQANRRRIEQDGYYAIENRQYFHMVSLLIEKCLEFQLYSAGIRQAEKALRLDKGDHIGARYQLMALYTLTNEYDGAKKLIKQFAEFDEQLHFPLLILAIMNHEDTYGRKLLATLIERIPDAYTLFDSVGVDVYNAARLADSDTYSPLTSESLAMAIVRLAPILANSDYIGAWLFTELMEIIPQRMSEYNYRDEEDLEALGSDPSLITEEAIHEELLKNTLAPQSADDTETIDQLRDHPYYKGLNVRFIRALYHAGFRDPADLSHASPKYLLTLDDIGPGTVNRLRENGVWQ